MRGFWDGRKLGIEEAALLAKLELEKFMARVKTEIEQGENK
jgi:hypothetical protein